MKSRVLIAYILSPICFYIGDISSKIVSLKGHPKFFAELYQKSMSWSVNLEDWCEKDIMWKRVENEKDTITGTRP